MRIKILDALRGGEATVGELTTALGTSQQNVSKHLGILAGAGIVERRKEGNLSLYRIADESVFDLFHDYAQSALERQQVPITLKDFVRDYFSRLEPTE